MTQGGRAGLPTFEEICELVRDKFGLQENTDHSINDSCQSRRPVTGPANGSACHSHHFSPGSPGALLTGATEFSCLGKSQQDTDASCRGQEPDTTAAGSVVRRNRACRAAACSPFHRTWPACSSSTLIRARSG